MNPYVNHIEVGDASAWVLRRWTPPTGRALRVGLTGGIGSGKTTVADAWRFKGATVVDADQLAREVVARGSVGLQRITEEFGTGILNESGELNRAELAAVVFESDEARAVLEGITHPLIAAEAQVIREHVPAGEVFVYDVPLLVENNLEEEFDLVVNVDASEHIRLERLANRGLARTEARSRMAAQADRADRERIANIWIDNHGSRSEMTELASRVFTTWLQTPNAAGREGTPKGQET